MSDKLVLPSMAFSITKENAMELERKFDLCLKVKTDIALCDKQFVGYADAFLVGYATSERETCHATKQ